ncbi:MAG: hypothetical protein WCS72_10345 [Deltaproteobacteria bacterium]
MSDFHRGALRVMAAAAAAAWLAASPASAQEPSADLSTPAPPADPRQDGLPELTDVTFASVALTAAGFVTAFVVHEACHGVANLAMGNVPTIEPVQFLGFFPFFAVSPNVSCRDGSCVRRNGEPFLPGPRGLSFIVSSGILCQEITDEIILTERPRIRYETAPFLKGMLLFNTAASVAYGIANLAGIEPPEGDLRGLDRSSGVPHGVFAALVLSTAALDVARYFLPDVTWIPWVSRGSKVVMVGLVVAF